ncbi:DUF4255 domain-containing protein [Endozoicomonadaceae bacterium StTr2]
MSDHTPFEAVSLTLKDLVERDVLLGDSDKSGVKISLEVPDKEFVSTLPAEPVINMYLYSLQDNLERRSADSFSLGARSGNSAPMSRLPRLVNLNYMISCWSRGPEDNALVEQLLLSRIVQGLGKHHSIPPDMLNTYGYQPGPAGVTVKILLDQDNKRTQGEFWNALGAHPKPVISLELTVPVDVHGQVTTPVIKELKHRFKKIPPPGDSRQVTDKPPALIISGNVIGGSIDYSTVTVNLQSTDSGNPVSYRETRPTDNGFYAFQNIGPGTYVIWAENGQGGLPNFQSVLVGSDSGGNPIPVTRHLTL